MSDLTDAQLLSQAAQGSHDALGQIAQRYAGFVYSAALRQVRDAHLADDVTQAVFVILSKKITQISRDTILHGWLFTTTRYAANNALKVRARRVQHERQAAAMRHEMTQPIEPDEITPLLDAALADLGETDRGAVLLSYFGGQGWREVAGAIGSTEEAARKRVGRALVRMRQFFARRGVEITGAALVLSMETQSRAAAPAQLVGAITATMQAAPAGTAAAGIAKGVIHMMAWAKIKVAATFTVAVLATLGGAGAMVLNRGNEGRSAEEPVFVATLDNGGSVEIAGVSAFPAGDKSWNADGTPRSKPLPAPEGRGKIRLPEPASQIVFSLQPPQGAHDERAMHGMKWELEPEAQIAVRAYDGGDGHMLALAFHREDDQKSVNARVRFATGEWEVTAKRPGAGEAVVDAGVSFSAITEEDGNASLTVTESLFDRQMEIAAVDANGQEFRPHEMRVSNDGASRQSSVKFPVLPHQIDRIEFRTREFDKSVMFRNISLVPDHKTEFRIETEQK
jgi:RNA polymerase sigma factor (sigma-70 family)